MQKYESITWYHRHYARNFQEDDGKVPCGKNAQSNQQTMMVLGQLDVIGHSDEFVSRFLIGGFSSQFGCDEKYSTHSSTIHFEFFGQKSKIDDETKNAMRPSQHNEA